MTARRLNNSRVVDRVPRGALIFHGVGVAHVVGSARGHKASHLFGVQLGHIKTGIGHDHLLARTTRRCRSRLLELCARRRQPKVVRTLPQIHVNWLLAVVMFAETVKLLGVTKLTVHPLCPSHVLLMESHLAQIKN